VARELSIGEVARASGLRPSALRYYGVQRTINAPPPLILERQPANAPIHDFIYNQVIARLGLLIAWGGL